LRFESILIASRTIATTLSGCSSIMVQVNRSTHQPFKDEEILPPPVAFEDLGSGVIQPAINLDHELELAKHDVDVKPGIVQNQRPVGFPSGNTSTAQ
jgi:hypothetical protein